MPQPEIIPEVIRTEGDPPTPPEPPRQPGQGYIECDFCHCHLTRRGEVYKISDIARDYRDEPEKHKKVVAKLDEELAALRAEITKKDAEIATLKGSPGTSTKAKFL